jgi:hypothetical protein
MLMPSILHGRATTTATGALRAGEQKEGLWLVFLLTSAERTALVLQPDFEVAGAGCVVAAAGAGLVVSAPV